MGALRATWTDDLIVVDSREQDPLFPSAERATLVTGDYSVTGYTETIAVERKSAADLFSSLGGPGGRNRKRLLRAFRRLSLMPWGAFVVEATPNGLFHTRQFGRITPAHAMGTLLRWSGVYRVPVWFADNHSVAAGLVKSYLRLAWEEVNRPRHDRPECPCGGGRIVEHDMRWAHEETLPR